MEFYDGKDAEQVISDYIEREISEYKKLTDSDISERNIAPEAKQAFNRKPYYTIAGANYRKPVIK